MIMTEAFLLSRVQYRVANTFMPCISEGFVLLYNAVKGADIIVACRSSSSGMALSLLTSSMQPSPAQ